MLLYLSRVSQDKSTTVSSYLLETSPILESFGNAKTVRNDNSSRFGKFVQMQFDAYKKICGGTIIHYLLEKSRVVKQTENERNYHIFYQLCAGLEKEKKDEWHISEAETYHCLNQGNACKIQGVDDGEEFMKVRKAFETIQIPWHEQLRIFKLIAAILKLSNIKFEEEGSTGKKKEAGETTPIKPCDPKELTFIAGMLFVEYSALKGCLCNRELSIRGEKFKIDLTPEEAMDTRDALCKTIYYHVFEWLLNFINKKIQVSNLNNDTFIGILDIFGFEDFAFNSFEQLLINFANEKLQSQFNSYIFKQEQEEYDKEGINWSKIDFKDNQKCLDLIEKHPLGLLALLNEECRFPKATDDTFLSKLHHRYSIEQKHENYIKPKPPCTPTSFIISHYAGNVCYETLDILEKNKDSLPEDLKNCIEASSDEFTRTIFLSNSDEGREAVSNGKESEGVLTTIRKGGPGTVASFFKKQLTSLMTLLGETQPNYIRCFKPNSQKIPENFDKNLMLAQLKYSGMIQTVEIRKQGFPVRMNAQEFFFRFQCLLSDPQFSKLDSNKNSFDINDTELQIGKTKIFLKEKSISDLELQRQKVIEKYVLKIQSFWRVLIISNFWISIKLMKIEKNLYLEKRKKIIKIQLFIKRYLARKKLSILKIQFQKQETERLLQEENERLESQRLEQERLENQRLEEERLQKERLEFERLEQERIEKKILRNELENQRIVNERLKQENLEYERLEQERFQEEQNFRLQIEEEERIEREKIDEQLQQVQTIIRKNSQNTVELENTNTLNTFENEPILGIPQLPNVQIPSELPILPNFQDSENEPILGIPQLPNVKMPTEIPNSNYSENQDISKNERLSLNSLGIPENGSPANFFVSKNQNESNFTNISVPVDGLSYQNHIPTTNNSSPKKAPKPSGPPPSSVQLQVGSCVAWKFLANTDDEIEGIVRYIGKTHFAPGEWIGLELGSPHGKNDGSIKGVQYFHCRPNFGVFTQRSKCAVLVSKTESDLISLPNFGIDLPPAPIPDLPKSLPPSTLDSNLINKNISNIINQDIPNIFESSPKRNSQDEFDEFASLSEQLSNLANETDFDLNQNQNNLIEKEEKKSPPKMLERKGSKGFLTKVRRRSSVSKVVNQNDLNSVKKYLKTHIKDVPKKLKIFNKDNEMTNQISGFYYLTEFEFHESTIVIFSDSILVTTPFFAMNKGFFPPTYLDFMFKSQVIRVEKEIDGNSTKKIFKLTLFTTLRSVSLAFDTESQQNIVENLFNLESMNSLDAEETSDQKLGDSSELQTEQPLLPQIDIPLQLPEIGTTPQIDVPQLPQTQMPTQLPETDMAPQLPNMDVPPQLPKIGMPTQLQQPDMAPQLPQVGVPLQLPKIDAAPQLPQIGMPTQLQQPDVAPKLPQVDIPTQLPQTQIPYFPEPQLTVYIDNNNFPIVQNFESQTINTNSFPQTNLPTISKEERLEDMLDTVKNSSESNSERIKILFDAYDYKQRGKIVTSEFESLLEQLSKLILHQEFEEVFVKKVIQECDEARSGDIKIESFINWFRLFEQSQKDDQYETTIASANPQKYLPEEVSAEPRNALLDSIRNGKSLKKNNNVNDRSAPVVVEEQQEPSSASSLKDSFDVFQQKLENDSESEEESSDEWSD